MELEIKKYNLPPLPYNLDALEPYISKDIVDVHYNGHHKGYVDAANKFLDRYIQALKNETAYDIQGIIRGIVFNLNGHKLHTLYWHSMAPYGKGGGVPGGVLADMINRQFGSFDNFKRIFTETANSLPGTGWTALYYDPENNSLQIMTFENHFNQHLAELPVLLILDEFEHAYYLQYKNKRADYVGNWWNLVNWEEAENKLRKHLSK